MNRHDYLIETPFRRMCEAERTMSDPNYLCGTCHCGAFRVLTNCPQTGIDGRFELPVSIQCVCCHRSEAADSVTAAFAAISQPPKAKD